MAILRPTSEKVVAVLTARKFTPAITPVRSYAQQIAKYELAESEGLRCDVVPHSRMNVELETQASLVWRPITEILIRKKFAPSDYSEAHGFPKNEAVDPLVDLVEDIYSALVAVRLSGTVEAAWQSEEIVAAYLPSHLRDKQQFTGIIRVTHYVSTDLPT